MSAEAARSLHVLVIGSDTDVSVCGTYRTRMYIPHLARLGVEVRYGSPTPEGEGAPERDELSDTVRSGGSVFERTDVEWADVLVFRRAYQTHFICADCGFACLLVADAREHAAATRHNVEIGPQWLVRPFVERLEADPASLRGRAIVYETDDDLLDVPADNDYHRIFPDEDDLVARLARFADLVTVSTPVLEARFRQLNPRIRVLRNAIDPEWYSDDELQPRDGEPRILYYGAVGRLRDYELCRDGVDAVARAVPGTRRVWLGAPSQPDQRRRIQAVVDDVLPYVMGVAAFGRALHEARPDIGVAPVLGDWFDRAKSELHWLEYSMAGAATVASRTMGDGPYRVIRNGVDGYLARGKGEWRDALLRLARSRTLREEVAGRARERVLREYHVERRAAEWADAFRWAAEHAGEGRTDRLAAARDRRAPRTRAAIAPAAPARLAGPGMAATAVPAQVTRAALDPQQLFAAYVAARAFAGRSPLRLHLGCGAVHLDGFVNADADASTRPELSLDPVFGLPFDDRSVDAIYAWRTIDDLGDAAAVFAVEAGRVLKPGAALRLVTRDRVAAVARRDRSAAEGLMLAGPAARVPMLDRESLVRLFEGAGFAAVREAARDESDRAELRGLESRRAAEFPPDALILEAVR